MELNTSDLPEPDESPVSSALGSPQYDYRHQLALQQSGCSLATSELGKCDSDSASVTDSETSPFSVENSSDQEGCGVDELDCYPIIYSSSESDEEGIYH